MAEVIGSYNFASFSQAVCMEVGWSLYNDLESDQQLQIKLIINRAVQEYYNSHEWTFLNGYAAFDTVVGQQEYDCPDNFGNVLEGDAGMISFPYDPSTFWPPVENVPEHQWRYNTQTLKTFTTFPSIYCVVPKTQAGATGQRFQLKLWPTPNQIWSPMRYVYRVLTNELTEASPYALGGNTHGMAIMNMCLAQACTSISNDLERAEFFMKKAAAQLEQNKINDGLNKSSIIWPQNRMGGGMGGVGPYGMPGINGRYFGAGAGWPMPFLGTGHINNY